MKIRDLIMVGGFGLAVASYYNNYIKKDDEKSFFPSFSGGGSLLSDVFGGVGSGEVYDTELSKTPLKESQSIETENLKSSNFKTAVYIDDYKHHSSHSSSKKSKKRTYVQNDDLDFTIVKDNGKTIGGFDFKTRQSLTKKSAKNLEKNKNNPIVRIARGF